MQINISNFNTTNFKGYDACPIKNIYMQGIGTPEQKNIYMELKEVGKKEGFDVLYYDDISKISSDDNPTSVKFASRWAQDDKTFIETQDGKAILSDHWRFHNSYGFAKAANVPIKDSFLFIHGGNVFIGKKPNGEKWAIVGQNKQEPIPLLTEFGKAYNIDPKNIYGITRPNYHIDMAIRPIGYPYVLVNDENLAKKQIGKNKELDWKVKNFYEKLNLLHPCSDYPYANCNKTIKELRKAGFIPIRIGGVFTNQINYMNAIINEHPDGTISYITNSARGSEFEELDKVFERELRAKVPNIRDVHFISGGKTDGKVYPNSIMQHLGELRGGLHCLTLEEPDFERWG